MSDINIPEWKQIIQLKEKNKVLNAALIKAVDYCYNEICDYLNVRCLDSKAFIHCGSKECLNLCLNRIIEVSDDKIK